MSELIAPPYARPAASPYSPGLLTGDWNFLSGQGGFDLAATWRPECGWK
jgi:enamine deaminase RidA (YjgF/YER057c/UK114 family)